MLQCRFKGKHGFCIQNLVVPHMKGHFRAIFRIGQTVEHTFQGGSRQFRCQIRQKVSQFQFHAITLQLFDFL